MLLTLLLSINFTAHPYWLTLNNYEDYTKQFNKYLSAQEYDKLQMTAFWSAIFISLASLGYLSDTSSCIKEENKVAIKYPNAQKWYDAMHEKYPLAHFDQKQFLQTEYEQKAAFYNIYFSQDSLQQINIIYTKKLDNKTLTDDEQLILAQKEFLLLYQAGYIEENCARNKSFTILGTLIATESLIIPATNLLIPKSHSLLDLKNNITTFESYYTMLSIADLFLFIAVYMPSITKYFDNTAYKFAYTQCDNDCLEAAIKLFENDTINKSRIEDIKFELQRRQELSSIK